MRTYSKLLNRYYDSDKAVYICNWLQCAKYMKHGGEEYLVDILCDKGKKEDCLTFVFEKSPFIKELYRKWNAHELN